MLMEMDTALYLRKQYDHGVRFPDVEIRELLEESKIVKRLTADYEEKELFNIFRIICLSEIPYVDRLPYTQKVLGYLGERVATDVGFSYTGKVEDIVPCYNALLLEAYVRLGLVELTEVGRALDWIKNYQLFERNQKTKWCHQGICKHGGCLKATPCYIGIGKTLRALITYRKYSGYGDTLVDTLISRGADYMLKHQMYQRLSNGQPISKHLIDIMFPQAYMLSLTDLVYIGNELKLWGDERMGALKELVTKKEVGDREWKIDYIYGHKGYKGFEGKGQPSQWIEYLFLSK